MRKLALFFILPSILYSQPYIPVFVQESPLQFDVSEFLEFVKTCKMQNYERIKESSLLEDGKMVIFYSGKDEAYADIFEYFRDD